jgi:hypothetical protein
VVVVISAAQISVQDVSSVLLGMQMLPMLCYAPGLQAPRMAAAFTDKRAALQLLVQRIAEERIRPALDA